MGNDDATIVGRIIFADLLSLPLARYRRFIEMTEGSPLFQALTNDYGGSGSKPVITIKRLSRARVEELDGGESNCCVAGILKSGDSFTIRYSHWGFNGIYRVERQLLPAPLEDSEKLFHRLRRITSRNILTHAILRTAAEHQREFLLTGNATDLRELSQGGLADTLSGSSIHEQLGARRVDPSWVCRLIKGLSVNVPSGDEIMLKDFFQSSREVNGRLLVRLLEEERESIEAGELKKPYTDDQIGTILADEHDVLLSRSAIQKYRRMMGIPSSTRRSFHDTFPSISARYSGYYPLDRRSVWANAPASCGVYELSLRASSMEYPLGSSSCIYLGSTKNLARRLQGHLNGSNRNSYMLYFMKNFECSFRYINVSGNLRKEEGGIYDMFVKNYGAAPRCNRVRP